MAINDDLKELISIMRCPSCLDQDSLALKEEAHDFDLEIPLAPSTVYCEQCNDRYPITDDLIPIMWSDNLKNAFTDIDQSHKADNDEINSGSNLSANVKIYDDISTRFDEFRHHTSISGNRIVNAAKKLHPHGEIEGLYHLDFGCGPGHVLKWIKPFGFKQIGCDVSLHNLRNARNNSGCAVVCGDASNMPFKDDIFSLVTESSALHHILDWKSALFEAIRVCGKHGGIIIDTEPSKIQMDWSSLAIAVFNFRFPVYKALSYFMKDKYVFRDTQKAKLNLLAEIHMQPKTGFPLETLKSIFEDEGFNIRIISSPTAELKSKASPGWKDIVINLLSGRNPWNPMYDSFMAYAKRN